MRGGARWFWALAGLLAVGGAALAQAPVDRFLGIPEGGGPVDVGAVPRGLGAVDAASCAPCHATQHAEWSRSVHRTAYTNAVFEAEYGRRRRVFCARCHAPRTDASGDGIDCATCHVRDGAILNPVVSGRAPHESRVAPALAEPEACMRCHEFTFEGQADELLQRTHSEWATSAAGQAGRTCQQCHMEASDGHHRHDAPGSRDASMRARALTVDGTARRVADGTAVELVLAVDGAGHAVPTGDMFRRLEVRAWPVGAPGEATSAWLRRRFRIDRRGWHEFEDSRVQPTAPRIVRLAVPDADRVAWAVDLWLLPRSEAERAGIPLSEVRLEMATGTLPVE